MDNWKHIGIAGDQDNIFLSATMTGNLQLIRLEHIGYFRYNSKCKQWEAVLCDKRFFVKFGGNLFFISTVFFFLNPIKSCRYVCFLVTLKTPHH